jgi:hypothetical protein
MQVSPYYLTPETHKLLMRRANEIRRTLAAKRVTRELEALLARVRGAR